MNNTCTCNDNTILAYKLTDINGIEYYAEYDSELDEDTFRLEWNMGLDEFSIVEAYFDADDIAEGIASGFWVVEAIDGGRWSDGFDLEKSEDELAKLEMEANILNTDYEMKAVQIERLRTLIKKANKELEWLGNCNDYFDMDEATTELARMKGEANDFHKAYLDKSDEVHLLEIAYEAKMKQVEHLYSLIEKAGQ